MKQPRVAFFGGEFNGEQRKEIEDNTTPFYFADDMDLKRILVHQQPDILVSIGKSFASFKQLCDLDLRDRERWLHYSTSDEVVKKLDQLYYCFVSYGIKAHRGEGLITVFTTSYKSKEYILRPFNTLRNQTYTNWEWIIFDDTDSSGARKDGNEASKDGGGDGGENFEALKRLKDQDPRIRIYRADQNSGIIGNVKNIASSLARGEILIEVDHDDDLTPRALELTYKAFQEFPDAGFVYSDFSEIFENGDNFAYSELFGVGYGAYRKEYYAGKWRNVCCCPPINPITIRYIVACPNHLRAWRRSTLQEIGGWNAKFHVADDFECMIRTFLQTKMVRIPELCYLQYRNAGGNNQTFIRNREIQKLVRVLATYYNNQIHDRLVNELEVADPHHRDWFNWGQFGKSWMDPKWEGRLNYIAGRDAGHFSVVLTVEEGDSPEELQMRINQVLEQLYPKKEVIVIGMRCGWLDGLLESNKTQQGLLKWWNLKEGDRIDALNYALKMVAKGPIIAYWSEEFEQRDYLVKIWKELSEKNKSENNGKNNGENNGKNNGENNGENNSGGKGNRKISEDICWSENRLAHLDSVFEKVGFWPKNGESLWSLWSKESDQESIQESGQGSDQESVVEATVVEATVIPDAGPSTPAPNDLNLD